MQTAYRSKRLLLIALLLTFSLGASAEDWTLKDKDGVRRSLSDLHGRWVLVNFWAPWCPACLQEMPDFVSLQKAHADLQIIGVAVMYKSRPEVMNIVQTRSITYPVVFGNEDTAGDFGGIAGLPTSFLYSPEGKLIGRHAGPLTGADIEQAIAGKSAALFTR